MSNMPNKLYRLFGMRLRSARIAAGLTLRELSARLGYRVSYNALAKYEKGLMMPEGEVLRCLGIILNRPKEYFVENLPGRTWEIAFRRKKGMSLSQVASLGERVNKMFTHYCGLERLLGIEHVFVNPLNDPIIRTGADAEAAAEQVRKIWETGSGPILSVTKLIEEQHIVILYEDLDKSFEGISGWAKCTNPLQPPGGFQATKPIPAQDGFQESTPVPSPGVFQCAKPLILLNSKLDHEQRRHTALRELGNLLLGFDEKLSLKDCEHLCTRFSAAFILPRETFFRELGRKRYHISTPELIRMRETYGIPVKGLMSRAKTLEVICDYTYKTFRMRISVNPAENDLGWFCGRESGDRFKSMVFRAEADGLIFQREAAGLLNLKENQFRMESLILRDPGWNP